MKINCNLGSRCITSNTWASSDLCGETASLVGGSATIYLLFSVKSIDLEPCSSQPQVRDA